MNAKQNFIEAIERQAGITKKQAELVFEVYLKLKVVKFTLRGVDLSHGAFLDKDVILRALRQA